MKFAAFGHTTPLEAMSAPSTSSSAVKVLVVLLVVMLCTAGATCICLRPSTSMECRSMLILDPRMLIHPTPWLGRPLVCQRKHSVGYMCPTDIGGAWTLSCRALGQAPGQIFINFTATMGRLA